ncbi:MAG: hypothetical protein ACLT46_07945 [Hungatella sp.]
MFYRSALENDETMPDFPGKSRRNHEKKIDVTPAVWYNYWANGRA